MRIRWVQWDEENIAHVAEHDLSVEEVEAVLLDLRSLEDRSGSSGNPMRFGYTQTGRFVAVVYEVLDEEEGWVLPITAYEVDEPRRPKRRKKR